MSNFVQCMVALHWFFSRVPADYFLLELANGVAPTATDEETCHFE